MTDINSRIAGRATNARKRTESTEAYETAPTSELAELLYFAYREFTAEPDAVLARYGFGRAHHRVLHFVNRSPGLRVADLLDILRITKQSLARVLKGLVERGFVEARAGHEDRRERLLFLTEKGRALAALLVEMQNARLDRALDAAGAGGRETVRAFLLGMIGDSKHAAIDTLVTGKDRGTPPIEED